MTPRDLEPEHLADIGPTAAERDCECAKQFRQPRAELVMGKEAKRLGAITKRLVSGVVPIVYFALPMLAAAQVVAQQHDPQAMLQRVQGLVPAFLDLDGTMVAIDSPSGYGPGLAKVEAIVTEAARGLDAEVETVKATVGPGNNVIARWHGTGRTRILLLAHMDTVFEEHTTKEVPFRIDGRRAYGPGVLDDKGGIALALMAVRLLKEQGFTDYGTVTLMATTDEEKASLGSRDLIRQVARESDYAFVMEFGSPDDKVTNWRKGVGYLVLEVTGRAAHSGAEPEKGCNADVELAHQVLQMGALGDSSKETTVSFTTMQGGERSNIIPDRARAQADVRVLDPNEFDRLDRDIAVLTRTKRLACAQIQASLRRGRPPFPANPDTEELVARSRRIYREIGFDLGIEGSGGGTDGNYTASVSTPTLDALGPVGGGAHTLGEYIELDRVAPRIYLLARLMMDVSGGRR